MSTTGIFDTAVQVLDKVLDFRTRKHQIISSNIANAETPGYSKIEMEFEEQLRQAVSGYASGRFATHPRHMPVGSGGDVESVRPRFYREKDPGEIGDGNSVRLEQEMVNLSVNQIRFEAAIQSLNKKLSMLKYVIQEKM